MCFDKGMLVYSPLNQAWVNICEIPRQEMEILQCLASPAWSLIILGWLKWSRRLIVQEVVFRGEHVYIKLCIVGVGTNFLWGGGTSPVCWYL